MSIARITSRKNPLVKKAFEYKKSPKEKFLVEGFHLIEEANKAGLLEEVFSVKEIDLEGVIVHLVNKDIIDKLAFSKSPEGIVGICHKKESKPLSSNHVLVLDRVQDPGNVGTLIRSALCFNFKDVILLLGCASPYGEKAMMASQGALFGLNIISCNIEEALKILTGYALIGTTLESAKSLDEMGTLPDKLALLLGNEGQGISKELLSKCDYLLKVEMENFDSLNVSIAGSILMHGLKK